MSYSSFMGKLLDGVEVEWKSLRDISEYSPTRVDASELGAISFVGVDNLVANKGGRVDATYLPNTDRVTAYEIGDILLGNIRPYLKKIWKATNSGGCSGDVLAIRILSEFKQTVDSQYLYYLLSSDEFFLYNMLHAKGAKMPRGNKTAILSYEIPIPCPDNKEKSLEIQAEIVRILDAFSAMTVELIAELNMRKKQYNHYQFEMLQFTETTQYLKIGECCDIKKGLTPIKKATPGKHPLVATTEERQSSLEYQFDCAAVCVPLISSRGHGVASIDRIYFQDGKFALGNILCAIIPNDSRVLSAKFLRYYLFDKKDVLLVSLMRGGANVSLTMDSLKKVKIPIPPIADQQRIVRILDKFDELVKGLPHEIELHQKQYEYYRDLLLSFPRSNSDVVA